MNAKKARPVLGAGLFFMALWTAGHPPLPPSARVWPPSFRAAVCSGYEGSLGKAPLAADPAPVRALLADADYPPGAPVIDRLDALLDAYERANARLAAGDVQGASLILGMDGHDIRYEFYDAITALTAVTGEHCSA